MEMPCPRVKILRAVREQVWLRECGKNYAHHCPVHFCQNLMTVFDFHVAHRRALAAGGDNSLANLVPLCARCNHGMATQSIEEWEAAVVHMPATIDLRGLD